MPGTGFSVTGLRLGADRQSGVSFHVETGGHIAIVRPSSPFEENWGAQFAGLVPHAACDDVALDGCSVSDLPEYDRAARIGYIPNVPSLVFSRLSRTLINEMRLSFRVLGRDADDERISGELEQLDLTLLRDQDPFTLSGGEQVRAAIALVLVKHPRVLILDNVFQQFDSETEKLVLERLTRARADGIIIVELHSQSPFRTQERNGQWLFATENGVLSPKLHDSWRTLTGPSTDLLPPFARIAGKIEAATSARYDKLPTSAEAVASPLEWVGGASKVSRARAGRGELSCDGLAFSYKGDSSFRFGPTSFALPLNSTTALVGKNGAGKTTLLRMLARLNDGWRGTLSIRGERMDMATPLSDWATRIMYTFQNPDDQIYLPTVRDEIVAGLRHRGLPQGEMDKRVERVSALLGLGSVLESLPSDLGFSYRKLTSLASAFAFAPSILLLDEPTAGLDVSQRAAVVAALREFRAADGTAIVVSHDAEFVCDVADYVVEVARGQIAAVSPFDTVDWEAAGMRPAAFEVGCALHPEASCKSTDELLANIAAREMPKHC